MGKIEYRLRVYLRSAPILQLQRFVNGTETVLGTVNLAIPGGAYTPGQVLHLRFLGDGDGPDGAVGQGVVRRGGRAGGLAGPGASDSTASLQRPGGVGVHAYLSSSATNAPVALSADNLQATTPGNEGAARERRADSRIRRLTHGPVGRLRRVRLG